jgi:hypothetical protein
MVFEENAVITVSDVAYPEPGCVVATRGGDPVEFDEFVAYQP